MTSQTQAIDAARRCAADRGTGWSEASVTVRRADIAGDDCWIVLTDTPAPEPADFMAAETDAFVGYVVRVADGHCLGLQLPFGLQRFDPGG